MTLQTPLHPNTSPQQPVASDPGTVPVEGRFRRIVGRWPMWVGAAALLMVLVYALWPSGLRGSAPEPSRALPKRSVEIEVLNATSASRVAQRMTDFLRSEGFDVVQVGNTKESARTMVLDRTGNRAAAEKVGKSLGLPPDGIVTKIDRTLYVDVSVVVGKDFPTLKVFH